MLDRDSRHFAQIDLLVGRRGNGRPRSATGSSDPRRSAASAAPRVDGRAEAAPQCRRRSAPVLGQRFGIANDGRQRGAQFVAGVGDEIGAHPLGRAQRRAVGQPDQPRSVGKRPAQAPRPVGRADPDQLDVGLAARQDRIERQRMADGEAQVAANDAAPSRSRPPDWRRVPGRRRSAQALRSRREGRGQRVGIGHGAEPNVGARAALGACSAIARRLLGLRHVPTARIRRIG